MEYTIKYKAKNSYETEVTDALWQFLIAPQDNESQKLRLAEFKNSLNAATEESTNSLNFNIYRVIQRKAFKSIEFEANFIVRKEEVNPFSALDSIYNAEHYELINSLDFRITHEQFLNATELTQYPKTGINFEFEENRSVFDNLQQLNNWLFSNFKFKQQVTDTRSTTEDFVSRGAGVCQDFIHLFLAIARHNKIPTRYTSGYLHQGNGYKGDSQMHAWAECYIPEKGWLGFDPTNNLIALENHIKVAHGKDYSDCSPIKGVLYTSSSTNTTEYSVEVFAREENAPDVFTQSQSQGFGERANQQQLDFQMQWQQQQQQQQQQLREQSGTIF
ncbi:MAG: transglutaminase [Leeuwenhoekiella sp.]|nr:MAG: transglutaminase [Leeuwenhoekiella sp.]